MGALKDFYYRTRDKFLRKGFATRSIQNAFDRVKDVGEVDQWQERRRRSGPVARKTSAK